jgi:hypothetical protein
MNGCLQSAVCNRLAAWVGLFENPRKIESATHRHFKEFRTRGEWFRVSAQEAIKTIQNISTPLYEEHVQSRIANDRGTRFSFLDKVKIHKIKKGLLELIFQLIFAAIAVSLVLFLLKNLIIYLTG